jgi:hypothetical protein
VAMASWRAEDNWGLLIGVGKGGPLAAVLTGERGERGSCGWVAC